MAGVVASSSGISQSFSLIKKVSLSPDMRRMSNQMYVSLLNFVVCISRQLFDLLCHVTDLPSRSRLRSSTSRLLAILPSRLVTVGDCSFSTAGPPLCNTLHEDVQSASSLTIFRQKLKFHFDNHTQTLLCRTDAIVSLKVLCT